MRGPVSPLASAELGWGLMGIAWNVLAAPAGRLPRDNHPARWARARRWVCLQRGFSQFGGTSWDGPTGRDAPSCPGPRASYSPEQHEALSLIKWFSFFSILKVMRAR